MCINGLYCIKYGLFVVKVGGRIFKFYINDVVEFLVGNVLYDWFEIDFVDVGFDVFRIICDLKVVNLILG